AERQVVLDPAQGRLTEHTFDVVGEELDEFPAGHLCVAHRRLRLGPLASSPTLGIDAARALPRARTASVGLGRIPLSRPIAADRYMLASTPGITVHQHRPRGCGEAASDHDARARAGSRRSG